MKKNIVIMTLLSVVLILNGCSSKTAKSESEYSSFPEHSIDVIIPFGEGSASDTFGRKFSQIITKESKNNYQPVNKDGSGGLSGMLHAYKQDNDGYTIMEVTPSHIIGDVLEKGKDIKFLDEFEPLAQIQSDVYVLSVSNNSDIKNYEDLIEKGKKEKITFGGISPAGLDDFAINDFAKKAGIKTQFIPYPSGSEVKAAALGGEVDVYVDKVVNVVDYVKAKRVKPLVVFGDERISELDELKDTPSTKEKGIESTIGSWRGFVVKKDTPPEVKEKLTKQLKMAYDTKEYKKFAHDNFVDIGEGYLEDDEFEKKMNRERKKFEKVAQDLDMK